MKTKFDLSPADVDQLIDAYKHLNDAVARYDKAYHHLAIAISDMRDAAQKTDFFIGDRHLTMLRRHIDKARAGHNALGVPHHISSIRVNEVIDQAIRENS